MHLYLGAHLKPAGLLLLPVVAKVSKSTLLPVIEGRSGGKFFRFNSVMIFRFQPFCLSATKIILYLTEKIYITTARPEGKAHEQLCLKLPLTNKTAASVI